MMKHWFHFSLYSLTVVAIALIAGCGPSKVSDDAVVASWGDTAMTVAQFKNFMIIRNSNEAAAKNASYDNRLNILQEYTLRDLKLLEGKRLGIDQRTDIRKAYDDEVARKSGEVLFNTKVRNRIINEAVLKDFWEHSRYEVRARHILIKVDPKLTGRDTLQYWNRIQEVYRKAKAGESFTKLVDQFSEDSSIDRSLHGDLGYFYWGKMVEEFEEAVWKLEPSEISPPVRTKYGYHIIQLLDKRSTGLEVNTSHILVRCDRRATAAETTLAYERAMQILKEAQKPGADFAALAFKYSEDKKTWNSGEVGWLPRGSMPNEYWEKAFTIKIGEIGGPVRSYKGYHIIKVNDRRDRPFDLSDNDYRAKLYSRISRIYGDSLSAASKAYMESVKRAFGLKYSEETARMLLTKLGDKNIPQNMSPFSALTPEDREQLVLTDNIGGMKVQELVDAFGDHREPLAYRNELAFIQELAEPIVMQRYMAKIAREEGLDKDPEVVEEATKALNNSILPEVEREMIQNKAMPTDDQIKDYYQKHTDKYGDKATATVYEIQVDDKQLAQDLLGRINKGEDISTLAQRYTQRSSSRGKGGRLGPFARDKYGALSEQAFKMEPGQLAGPIGYQDKFSIIKLIEKKPASVKTLEEVRTQVESDLRYQVQEELNKSWDAELRKAYKLKINESVLKAVWPQVPQLSKDEEKARNKLEDERADRAKQREKENQIKVKLKPGSEQEYTTKEGKNIKVKIGEPQYLDKDGKPVDASKSKIKLTPKGTIETKEGGKIQKPVIKLEPKKKGG